MTPEDTEATETLQALMQFLYRAPIGLVQISPAGDIEMINPMSAQLLMPLSPDGTLDNLFAVLGPTLPHLRALVADFREPSGMVCEGLRITQAPGAANAASGGAPASARVLAVGLTKLDAAHLMAVITDVSLDVAREQRGLARRLRDAERTDGLTNLPNRAAVRDRLALLGTCIAESDEGGEYALLFMNCDRFKQINDTLGQAVGDELLGMMTERLRGALRNHERLARPDRVDASRETLLARVGGDEFVVLLDRLGCADDVHAVAQCLLDTLSLPYGIGKHQVHCSVSMGVMLRAQIDLQADEFLNGASIAMAEAKRDGGARYRVFEPAMAEFAARRAEIEFDLRRAPACNQLFVVYQPVVGLQSDGSVLRNASVEALVRWQHPTRGVVPPLEFIGVAEACGLIGAIGDQVLAIACRQFVAWQQALGEHAPRSLAVNLSRAQLAQPGWVDSVQDLLRATGMPADCLQLEITESLAAQDEDVQTSLHALKALGLTLALDDFGTGYSSLSSLHLMPVDIVKIDRSFVSLLTTSPQHRVLIEATVRVAQSLGMRTVAEGIETSAQADLVRQLGCDKGQGYLFSKPLRGDELARWLLADTTTT